MNCWTPPTESAWSAGGAISCAVRIRRLSGEGRRSIRRGRTPMPFTSARPRGAAAGPATVCRTGGRSATARFVLKPMGFKHTGLFPEQAANWDWFSEKIAGAGRKIRVLNLFAYTGGATVAAAAAGASVVHVDASRGMVVQAKENAALSGLGDAPIRYIVDDCKKFVEREIRRGNRYEAVIMDPPSYGRGPSGEVWKIEDSVDELIGLAAQLLSDKPLFFLVNSYTTGLSPMAMEYILGMKIVTRYGGSLAAGELGLPVTATGLQIPCGASARWES